MNDQQRTRLAILGTSGLLFGCGILGWVWYKNDKQKEAEMNEPTLAPYVRIASRKQGEQAIPPAPGGPVKVAVSTPVGQNPPGATAPAVAVKPGPTQAPDASTTAPAVAVNPGAAPTPPVQAQTTQTPVQGPAPIVVPGKPTTPNTVATQPVQTAPVKPGQPGQPVATTVIKPGQPNVPPTPVAVKPGQPALPNPIATKTPPTVPPAPAVKPGQPMPTPPNATAVKPGQPTPAVAVKPNVAPVALKPGLPNGPALTPPGGPAIASGNTPNVVLPPTPAPVKPGFVPAISHIEASTHARRDIGRHDPMQPLAAYLPFPRTVTSIGKSQLATTTAGKEGLVPPPPPTEAQDSAESVEEKVADSKTKGKNKSQKDKTKLAKKPAGELVPPPPPTDLVGIDDLAGIQLPPPPDKPRISDKLQVISVMDDRAIITFPSDIQQKNKWPRTISLGVGDQFDSVKIVSVSPNGITVEEDGERSLREIPNIK